jgi:hypothetical protein
MKAQTAVVTQQRSQPAIPRLLALGLLTLLVSVNTSAQAGGAELKEKLAAFKQSATANQQRLHKYKWTEIPQVTFKGETKPQQEFACQYGPDGQVQKIPLTQQQQQPSGGKLKQRMIEKKKDEMQQNME